MTQFTVVFERYAYREHTTEPKHRWRITCEHCGETWEQSTMGALEAAREYPTVADSMNHHAVGCECGRGIAP